MNRVGFHCSRQARGPPDPDPAAALPGGSPGRWASPAVVSLVRLAVWRRSGSNRRPPACKAGALPTELRPRDLMQRSGQPSRPAFRPVPRPVRLPDMGQGGLEPPTPRLSSVCSNQLSYWPKPLPNPSRALWRAASARPFPARENKCPPGPEGCAAGALALPGPVAAGAARGGFRISRVCVRKPRERLSARVRRLCQDLSQQAPSLGRIPRASSLKGGDPAAGSPTATLLRLHPSR